MADREANLLFIVLVQAAVTSLWLTSDCVKDIAATSENMIEKVKKWDTINSEREKKLAEETFWKKSNSF